MYEIASSVAHCLQAGARVDVAWAVETRGFSSRDASEALALTPDGDRVGAVLAGAFDARLAELAAGSHTGRLLDLHVSADDAALAGLSCGGDARCLLIPATDLPAELWPLLLGREPVGLVTRLDGNRVVDTALFTTDTVGDAGEDVGARFARGVSGTAITADTAVTVLWPVPELVVVGAGAIADALVAQAALLGWPTRVVVDVDAARGAIAGLGRTDKLVVLSHDNELAGPALATALAGALGYIGALGSRRTQRSRADWLAAERNITDLARIHGPAGLDLGSGTPAEIAVSIVAEALAVASGRGAVSLRAASGPIRGTAARTA